MHSSLLPPPPPFPSPDISTTKDTAGNHIAGTEEATPYLPGLPFAFSIPAAAEETSSPTPCSSSSSFLAASVPEASDPSWLVNMASATDIAADVAQYAGSAAAVPAAADPSWLQDLMVGSGGAANPERSWRSTGFSEDDGASSPPASPAAIAGAPLFAAVAVPYPNAALGPKACEEEGGADSPISPDARNRFIIPSSLDALSPIGNSPYHTLCPADGGTRLFPGDAAAEPGPEGGGGTCRLSFTAAINPVFGSPGGGSSPVRDSPEDSGGGGAAAAGACWSPPSDARGRQAMAGLTDLVGIYMACIGGAAAAPEEAMAAEAASAAKLPSTTIIPAAAAVLEAVTASQASRVEQWEESVREPKREASAAPSKQEVTSYTPVELWRLRIAMMSSPGDPHDSVAMAVATGGEIPWPLPIGLPGVHTCVKSQSFVCLGAVPLMPCIDYCACVSFVQV